MRVVKMGHMQNVKSSFRVRIVVPSELSAHLPPPYTGKRISSRDWEPATSVKPNGSPCPTSLTLSG
jgi:hypothetical protein